MVESRKHKIAFIHPDLGIGGAERLVLDMAVALAEQGNEVLFVTNHFDRTHAFEELRDGRFPVRVVGDWIPRSICGICQALCAYFRMIYLSLVYVFFIRKEDNPDVYFVDQIPMAVPFIKCAGGKVVYYCHHPDLLASPPGGCLKRLYRLPIDWLELRGTSLADVILVNSKYTASVFRKTFPEITKDIHILYPTISASYQSTVASNRTVKSIGQLVPEIPTSKDTVIFLSINRYHPAKKLELALSGLEALKSKLSANDWARVYLLIAGGYDPKSTVNAEYFVKLVDIAHTKNLSTKVIFLKSPTDNLKADLLLTCDCLIYTPINEHFGIVPLEAMTAGKPVIACNSGGPCETVQHQVTGYLCEPTADSLAEAMSKMLSKSHSCRMGLLGKGRLQKYFSHETFTGSVNDVVTNLIYGKFLEYNQASRSKEDSKIKHTIPEIEQEFEEEESEEEEEEAEASSIAEKVNLPEEKCDNIKEEENKAAVETKNVKGVEDLTNSEGDGNQIRQEDSIKEGIKRFLGTEAEANTPFGSPVSSCYMSPVNVSTENLNTSDGSDSTVN